MLCWYRKIAQSRAVWRCGLTWSRVPWFITDACFCVCVQSSSNISGIIHSLAAHLEDLKATSARWYVRAKTLLPVRYPSWPVKCLVILSTAMLYTLTTSVSVKTFLWNRDHRLGLHLKSKTLTLHSKICADLILLIKFRHMQIKYFW